MQQMVALALGCALIFLLALGVPGQGIAFARTPSAGLNPCDAAASRAARASGVPVHLLLAITRVETGRSADGVLAPWPWTVNQAGDGAFLASASDAVEHVSNAVAAGKRNIDIGCFQINLRWHGAEFPSVQAMFDPDGNALYAARFLLRLYDEFGTWDGAVGAYHSRQSGAAKAYLAKVSALIGAAPGDSTDPPPQLQNADTGSARDNRYPLLRPGATASQGSLVSTGIAPATPLFW